MSAKHKKSHAKRMNMPSIEDLDEEDKDNDNVAEECEKI